MTTKLISCMTPYERDHSAGSYHSGDDRCPLEPLVAWDRDQRRSSPGPPKCGNLSYMMPPSYSPSNGNIFFASSQVVPRPVNPLLSELWQCLIRRFPSVIPHVAVRTGAEDACNPRFQLQLRPQDQHVATHARWALPLVPYTGMGRASRVLLETDLLVDHMKFLKATHLSTPGSCTRTKSTRGCTYRIHPNGWLYHLSPPNNRYCSIGAPSQP